MTDSPLPVPVRSFLDEWFVPVIVGCLLVAAIGGYLAYGVHIQTATATEEPTVGTWTVDSEFEHGATVQRDATVFEPGDRLENRGLYFTNVSPELDWNYTLTHRGDDVEPAMATVNVTLVAQATEEREGEELLHWRETSTLANQSSQLEAGETLVVGGTVHVGDLSDRIERIQEELDAAPGRTEVFLRTDATIEGTVGGEPVSETRRERLALGIDAAVYRVTADLDGATSQEVTESATVTVDPSPLEAYVSPLLLALGVLGAVGVGVARWRGLLVVTPEERARYEYEAARSDFEEWISGGTLPETAERTTVLVDSLPDLVDVAIDSNRRVIEDDERGCYAVLVDDVVYYYRPPTPGTEDRVDPLKSSAGSTVSPLDGRPSGGQSGQDGRQPTTENADGAESDTDEESGSDRGRKLEDTTES